MFDPLLADYFNYVEAQCSPVESAHPDIICRKLDIQLTIGPRSLARYRWQPDGEDIIFLNAQDYGRRDLFTVAHEIAHILAWRGGYIRAIQHYHASVPDMQRHIERIVNHAAGLILMPSGKLYEAVREFGDRPEAVIYLATLTGVSEGAAMRRWAWQDTSEYRAAFIASGNYIEDATACRARLPFRRRERVPELHLSHPDVSLLYLGGGRVMGTVA